MLKTFVAVLTIFTVACNVSAANAARIDLQGVLFDFRDQPELQIAYGHWQKPEMIKKYLTVNFPAAETWRTGKVTFTPRESGNVRMVLLGQYIKGGKNTTNQPAGIYYDNFRINEQLIYNGDFSLGDQGWRWVTKEKNYPGILICNPLIAKVGNNCVMAWHDGSITTGLKVEKDQPVTLTFDYKSAGDVPAKDTTNQYFPLPLDKVANMGLKDEVAGDGKGGWSDQGPVCDLRNFPTGLRGYKNWPFRVIDPKERHGKAMVVFKSANSRFGVASALIPAGNALGNSVALLNTCAWGGPGETAARVKVILADGKSETFPIRIGYETNDWWKPGELPNSTTAWIAGRMNGEMGVFLTVLKLKHPGKVKAVEVVPASTQVVFGLLGLTVGNILSAAEVNEVKTYRVKLKEKAAFTALSIAELKLDMAEAGIDAKAFFDDPKSLNRLEVTDTNGNLLACKIARFERNFSPVILVKTNGSTNELILKIGNQTRENVLTPRAAFRAVTGKAEANYTNDAWADGILLNPRDVKLQDAKAVADADSFYLNAVSMNAPRPEWTYTFELNKTSTFRLYILSRSPQNYTNQVYVSFDHDNFDFRNVDGSIIKVGGNCNMPDSYYWSGGPRITLPPGKHQLKLIGYGKSRDDFALAKFYLAADTLTPVPPSLDDEFRALQSAGFYVYGANTITLKRLQPFDRYQRVVNGKISFPDLSSLVDNHIDADGVLKADGRHFVFASGKPVPYLWGCNIGAPQLDDTLKDDSLDLFLQRLKTMGYSSVRYMITPLLRSWGYNQNNRWGMLLSTKPLTFDPNFLPRLQKLVAACHRNGLYLNLTIIGTEGNLIMTDLGLARHNHSYIGFFLPEAIQRQKQLTAMFLNTPNPYRNNICPADDPTLAIVEIENERNFVATFQMKNPSDWRKLPEPARGVLYRLWSDFLKQKYGSIERLKTTWGQGALSAKQLKPGCQAETFANIEFPPTWKIDDWGDDKSDFRVKLDDLRISEASYGKLKKSNPHVSDGLEFMYVIYRNYLKEMAAYIRSLGYKGIITANGPDCELFYSQRAGANEILDAVSGGTGYWNCRGYGFLRGLGWLSPLVYFAAPDKPIISREYGANLVYENSWWGNLITACVQKAMDKAYLFNFSVGVPTVMSPDWLYPDDSLEKCSGVNLNQEVHLYSHFANLAAAIAVHSAELKKPEFKLDIGYPLDNVFYAAPFRGYNKMTIGDFTPFLYTDSAVKTFHGQYDGHADLVINEPSIPFGDYSRARKTFMLKPHSSNNRYGVPENTWPKGTRFKAEGFMQKDSERQALFHAIEAAGGKMPVTLAEYGKVWRDGNRHLELNTVNAFFRADTATFGAFIGNVENAAGNMPRYYSLSNMKDAWSFYGILPNQESVFFAVANGTIDLKSSDHLKYLFIGTDHAEIKVAHQPFITILAGSTVNVSLKSDQALSRADKIYCTFLRHRSSSIPAQITFARNIKAVYACDAKGNRLGEVLHAGKTFRNPWGEGDRISYFEIQF